MDKDMEKFCDSFNECNKCILRKYTKTCTFETCEMLFKLIKKDENGKRYIFIELD